VYFRLRNLTSTGFGESEFQLLDDGVNTSIVSLLVYWYTHQQASVLWMHVQSSPFFIGNGTKYCQYCAVRRPHRSQLGSTPRALLGPFLRSLRTYGQPRRLPLSLVTLTDP